MSDFFTFAIINIIIWALGVATGYIVGRHHGAMDLKRGKQ